MTLIASFLLCTYIPRCLASLSRRVNNECILQISLAGNLVSDILSLYLKAYSAILFESTTSFLPRVIPKDLLISKAGIIEKDICSSSRKLASDKEYNPVCSKQINIDFRGCFVCFSIHCINETNPLSSFLNCLWICF